jgi:FkbM family methyltransferase
MGELFERFLQVGDELGVSTRSEFVSEETTGMVVGAPPRHEAFEWMALFDAIEEATGAFTMLELGAGFGRWTARAAAALRLYRPELGYRLVAVEAEPTHFEWLRLHMHDNRVDVSRARTCELISAAVSNRKGRDDYYFGDPSAWYGQGLVRPENLGSEAPVGRVRTRTLSSLLRPLDLVDLVDIDIQGAELEVLKEAAGSLERVRRIYVETHRTEIDEGLPRIFQEAPGPWSLVVAAPLNARRDTPLGEASFAAGGVQLWRNDEACAPRRSGGGALALRWRRALQRIRLHPHRLRA